MGDCPLVAQPRKKGVPISGLAPSAFGIELHLNVDPTFLVSRELVDRQQARNQAW
jgi:hypothetical protein